jgi:hypothetical protein
VLGIYCLWGVILYFSPPEYNSAWGMIHLGGYSILLSSGVIVLGFFSPGGLLCIIPLRCYCALGLFSWGVVLHYSSPELLCLGLIPLGPGGLLCIFLLVGYCAGELYPLGGPLFYIILLRNELCWGVIPLRGSSALSSSGAIVVLGRELWSLGGVVLHYFSEE